MAPDHLLVEVDLASLGQSGPVAAGDPVEVGHIGQLVLDGAGSGQAEADAAECLDPRSDRVGLGPPREGDEAGQELARIELLDRRAAPAQPKPERVERPHPHAGDVREPGLHLAAARRLKATTRDRGWAAAPTGQRSSRARSVSTRVLPEPAGAMTRAPAPGCGDCGELVGRRAAAVGVGSDRAAAASRARATMRWTTAVPSRPGRSASMGPPSQTAGVPSGRTTSAARIAVAARPTAAVRPPPPQVVRPRGRRPRWPRRRGGGARRRGRGRRASSHGWRPTIVSWGGDSRDRRGRGPASARRSPIAVARQARPSSSATSASTASTRMRSQSDHAAGGGAPGGTTTERPSVSGSITRRSWPKSDGRLGRAPLAFRSCARSPTSASTTPPDADRQVRPMAAA